MRPFTTDDAFPLSQIDLDDRAFMSRLNPERWELQVQALMQNIAQHGQLAPVGLARVKGAAPYVVIYGFTRTEAIRRLGRPSIRANLYEDLDERQARLLNADDNASHQQLTVWERAVQIKKLREAGVHVESQNGEPSIARIFGMSRRTVFNWLSVVDYPCPALHQALADEQIGLQHALLFVQYPGAVSERLLAPCMRDGWSSAELKLRLQGATLHAAMAPQEYPPATDRATLHAEAALPSEHPAVDRATLHVTPDGIRGQLEKAGRWLLEVSGAEIASWPAEEQMKLRQGLRMVLEVLASGRSRERRGTGSPWPT